MMLLKHALRRGFANTVKFTFVKRDGSKLPVETEAGRHLLDIAKKNDVELEGACEASLACSTCHVILPQEVYDALPPASDEEEDLLDLAFGLTATSRLGCQVEASELLEGREVTLPKASRNLYVDGTKPSHH